MTAANGYAIAYLPGFRRSDPSKAVASIGVRITAKRVRAMGAAYEICTSEGHYPARFHYVDKLWYRPTGRANSNTNWRLIPGSIRLKRSIS